MTHTSNAVKQKTLAWRMAAAVAFAAVVLTPLQSHAQDALVIGNNSNIGLGLANPARQLHLRGPNAAFRMDRNVDGTSFFLVRTDANWNPWKAFQFGVAASGPNNGRFSISDMGQAVTGGGAGRMTIQNDGTVDFFGAVRAPAFVTPSARHLKQHIEPLADAGARVRQLQGVRFVWKDSGRPSLGLIAEEVAAVFPELVERDDADGPAAVNYSALVAVLVEAVKEQQARMTAQETELAVYRSEVAAQQARVARLEDRLAEFETLEVRLNLIEGVLIELEPRMAALPKP